MSLIDGISIPPSYPDGGLPERALDLLFPPTCVGCRRVGRWICAQCWLAVPWLLERRCAFCGDAISGQVCQHGALAHGPVDQICVATEFDGIAREAVHALKYQGRHAISNLLGSTMALAAAGVEADVVFAVPLHVRRRRERGYDQAQMLARALARRLSVPLESRALRRIRYTTQQVTLGAEARRTNMAGAFEMRGDVAEQSILLVDDVLTTGATMSEAARTLRLAGAARIIATVFARAPIGIEV